MRSVLPDRLSSRMGQEGAVRLILKVRRRVGTSRLGGAILGLLRGPAR